LGKMPAKVQEIFLRIIEKSPILRKIPVLWQESGILGLVGKKKDVGLQVCIKMLPVLLPVCIKMIAATHQKIA